MLQATTVANEIIRKCNDRGIAVSNLKLQKLLYFVQAYSLAEFDRPAFCDTIEAWDYGPVTPTVYQLFKFYGPNPIPSNHYFDNIDLTERNLIESDMSIQQSINEILNQLGDANAFDLVRLSHEQGSPWHQVYTPTNSGAVIHTEAIKNFYRM